jgi:hypothetical protein
MDKKMKAIVLLICGLGAIAWVISRFVGKNRGQQYAQPEKELGTTNRAKEETTNEATMTNTEEETEDTTDPERDETKLITTRIMEEALKAIGCQPEFDQKGSIGVRYQGEKFIIEFGGPYARIWDTEWAAMNIEHPDIQILREAVNVTNFRFGPTVVITKPDDDGYVALLTRRDIMLHPSFPDNEIYIKSVLNSFFEAKAAVHDNFKAINAEQAEIQKKRRPVGFNATSD